MTRVEFEITPGAAEGTCRLCSAAIAWVRTKDSIMPLDLASVRRVRSVSGGSKRMAESHFAHCPEADLARGQSQRALCRVRACGQSIPRSRHFCPDCWKLVPRSLKGLLKDYGKRYGVKDERTQNQIRNACQFADQRRRKAANPDSGLLFGSAAEAQVDDRAEDPG